MLCKHKISYNILCHTKIQVPPQNKGISSSVPLELCAKLWTGLLTYIMARQVDHCSGLDYRQSNQADNVTMGCFIFL